MTAQEIVQCADMVVRYQHFLLRLMRSRVCLRSGACGDCAHTDCAMMAGDLLARHARALAHEARRLLRLTGELTEDEPARVPTEQE